MQTKTIDKVVREALMERGYPIHYYLPFLFHALKCLEELSWDFPTGLNIKEVKLIKTSYNRLILDSTVSEVISVYGLVAGERKEFYLNPELTNAYKLDGATEMPWLEEDTSLPAQSNLGSSTVMEQVNAFEWPTILFPTDQVDYEYGIDYENSEIVLGPRVDVDDIYVMYLSSGVSTTTANLIRPVMVNAILAFIDWKMEKSNGPAQSRIMEKKSAYYNEKRLLRGRLNPLTISNLYQLLVTN